MSKKVKNSNPKKVNTAVTPPGATHTTRTACGLNNLQKIRDGEPLGGKASAESDFATDDDEDFLN